MTLALSNKRGCGTREEGGLYAEFSTSKDGKPPEYFLFDSPKVVDFGKDGLDLPSIGQKIIAQGCYVCNGTGIETKDKDSLIFPNDEQSFVFPCQKCKGQKVLYHIADRIGVKHYPTVPHFVEEVRYSGASRRLNPSGDYSKLVAGASRFMFAHDLAYINDFSRYITEEPSISQYYVPRCPKNKEHHYRPEHGDSQEFCIRFLWEDLFTERKKVTPPGLYTVGPNNENLTITLSEETRQRIVTLPSGAPFYGLTPPESETRAGLKQYYSPAFFMWLPIQRLVVIRDKKKGSHEKVADRHSGGSLPVDVVED